MAADDDCDLEIARRRVSALIALSGSPEPHEAASAALSACRILRARPDVLAGQSCADHLAPMVVALRRELAFVRVDDDAHRRRISELEERVRVEGQELSGAFAEMGRLRAEVSALRSELQLCRVDVEVLRIRERELEHELRVARASTETGARAPRRK